VSHPDHTTSCLLTELFGRDDIDQSMDFVRIDDLIVVDPYEAHAPSLVSTDARRVSVEEHANWQASLRGPAQTRKIGETSRILDLLDELGMEREG